MATTVDSTESVNFLFRPIGYKNQKGKKPTVDEIENWLQKEKPGYVKRQPNLSLLGAIAGAIGLVAEIFGFKKENSFVKWLGGALMLLGVAATGGGILWTKFVDELREVAKSQSSNNSNTAKKLFDEEAFISDLKIVSKIKDIREKDIKRKELLSKYSEHIQELEGHVYGMVTKRESKKEQPDKDLLAEASYFNEFLFDKKVMKDCLPKLRTNLEARRYAAKALSEVITSYEPELVNVFIECVNNRAEDSQIKSNALYGLARQAKFDPATRKKILDLYVSLTDNEQESIEIRERAASCIRELEGDNIIPTLLSQRKKHFKNQNLVNVIEKTVRTIIQGKNNGNDIILEKMGYIETKIDDLNIDEAGSTTGEFNYFDLAFVAKDIPSMEIRNLIKAAQKPITQDGLIELFSKHRK